MAKSWYASGAGVRAFIAASLNATLRYAAPMTDKGMKTSVVVSRLPDGGYVVSEPFEPQSWSSHLLAASGIDVALDYVKHVLEPVPPMAELKPLKPGLPGGLPQASDSVLQGLIRGSDPIYR